MATLSAPHTEKVSIVWTRRILLAGTFFGMLASYRLWLTSRRFPLVPVADWVPTPPPPWDAVLFGSLLALLVAAWWFHRWPVVLSLVGALFLVLTDQTRLQPWFYMYAVMLFLTLFPARVAVTGCRLAISGVYVWSGVQKLNGSFFDEVVPWFAEPARRWLSEGFLEAVLFAIATAPFVEIAIGLAVWLAPLRKFAILTAFLLHAGVLLLLGPLGRDYNLVVWPWNLTMPLLLLVLFPDRAARRTWSTLRESIPAFVIVLLFLGLPALSYVGLWDTSTSFGLYSGNGAKSDLFVSPALARRLPEWLRSFLVFTEDGRPVVDVLSWSLAEVGVPPLVEPRSFRAIGRYVARYAQSPDEIELVIAPRVGRQTVEDGAALNPVLTK